MQNTPPEWVNILGCIFIGAVMIALVLAFMVWVAKNYQGSDKMGRDKWKLY